MISVIWFLPDPLTWDDMLSVDIFAVATLCRRHNSDNLCTIIYNKLSCVCISVYIYRVVTNNFFKCQYKVEWEERLMPLPPQTWEAELGQKCN